jgi:hypothetical protein
MSPPPPPFRGAVYPGQQIFFFFVPRTSLGELGSTFYAEFRYVCRIFLSGRVSKIEEFKCAK